MERKDWTDEWVDLAIQLNKDGLTYKEIAEEMTKYLGIEFTHESVKSKMKRVKKEGKAIQHSDFKEESKLKSDGSIESTRLLLLSESDRQNPESLLEKHGLDPDKYDLENAEFKRWYAYSKDDGRVPMFSCKIKAKPKLELYGLREMESKVDQMLKNKYTSPERPAIHDNQGDLTLEVNVLDLHLAKYAWTGDSDDAYDMDIAEDRFFDVIHDLIDQVEHLKFKKIFFLWSHDFFHYDNLAKTTTNGTVQDTNAKYQEMFDRGVDMLITAIEILSEIAPVETIYVGGNHDRITSYFASKVLYHHFLNDMNVEVDYKPLSRKYRLVGNTLLMFTHGDKANKRLDKIMPYEVPDLWAKSLFREIHKGHFHTERESREPVFEESGIVQRHIGSVSGTDTWHFQEGYTGSTKKSQHFVYHDIKGLRQIIYTNVL